MKTRQHNMNDTHQARQFLSDGRPRVADCVTIEYADGWAWGVVLSSRDKDGDRRVLQLEGTGTAKRCGSRARTVGDNQVRKPLLRCIPSAVRRNLDEAWNTLCDYGH